MSTRKTNKPQKLPPTAHRWNIASRTLLAVAGGYAIAAAATASLSLALPLPRAQAVMAATLLSFALYCALAVWAYSAATARRAWAVAAVLAVLPAGHLALRWATA
ncbi:iron transporter [Pusillimonas sp.]|uniref:iron transporter n=1 Tax=Pusillimonas sp. TaxID=3040095 RepID=UPI0037CA8125